jgi:hypothetical protein
MNATFSTTRVLRHDNHQPPSPREIRAAAAAIRRSWSPSEREFRREVGDVQRRRLAATLIRSAA